MRAAMLLAVALALAAPWPVPAARAQETAPEAPAARLPGAERPAPDDEALRRVLELRKGGPPLGQAGPVDAAGYVLGPGDLLQLELWGRLSRTLALEVDPEGRIFLPGSGSIPVGGRTLAATRERVNGIVNETFRGVRADLRLLRLRSFKVYASGFVNAAGALDATPVMRVSEVLARAGLGPEGSRRNVRILRRDGSTLRADFQLFEAAGRQELDPFVLDGDVLNVPRRREFISANGAVASPGRFELAPGDSLSTLLQLAGGLLPAAVRERALLVRFTGPTARESLWLDLAGVVDGRGDPPLRDGDQLFVPYVGEYHVLPWVEIYGEVLHPGRFPLVEGRDRLSDLVRWAGGFRPLANRSAIHLVRSFDGGEADPEFERLARLSRQEMTESEYAAFQTKLTERRNAFRVDFERIGKEGAAVDPLLKPQDLVRVEPGLLTVRVEGQVKRPGFVDYRPGHGVDEYVAFAGGYTNRAARGGVRISRTQTGQVLPVRGLRAVQPGDVIWVPERRDLDAWELLREVLTVAGQVAVIVVATRR